MLIDCYLKNLRWWWGPICPQLATLQNINPNTPEKSWGSFKLTRVAQKYQRFPALNWGQPWFASLHFESNTFPTAYRPKGLLAATKFQQYRYTPVDFKTKSRQNCRLIKSKSGFILVPRCHKWAFQPGKLSCLSKGACLHHSTSLLMICTLDQPWILLTYRSFHAWCFANNTPHLPCKPLPNGQESQRPGGERYLQPAR